MTEGERRRGVEEALARLAETKAAYEADPTDANGRVLLDAREAASVALSTLYAACPDERPPTQRVM